MSKTIGNHIAVLECDPPSRSGSDYKYDVILHEGWVFESGRMRDGRCGGFNTVKEFKDANPIRKHIFDSSEAQ